MITTEDFQYAKQRWKESFYTTDSPEDKSAARCTSALNVAEYYISQGVDNRQDLLHKLVTELGPQAKENIDFICSVLEVYQEKPTNPADYPTKRQMSEIELEEWNNAISVTIFLILVICAVVAYFLRS